MKRRLAACAVGLLVAGLWVSPASAAEVADLTISIDGATVPVDAWDKPARLTIVNTGPGVARDMVVTVDFGGLDPEQLGFDTAMCLEPNPTMCTFGVPDLPAGGKHTYHLLMINVGASIGPGGSLAAFVTHSGTEPTPADNVTSVDVAIVAPGVDLSVAAPDVYRWTADHLGETTTPIPPGDGSFAYAVVYNEGTRTADGVTVEVRVPEHVTIAGPDPDPGATCLISADRRTATCDYPDVALVPNTNAYFVEVAWPITVAADAPAGALTGGSVTVTTQGDSELSANTQEFSVFVAAPPSSPSPPPGGGGGGGLPVTGPMAGGLAAAGAGLLILGGALVLLARRRRVVLEP